MADLRQERLSEITAQIGIPMQFWAAISDLNPTQHRRTLEFLGMALQALSHINQIAKHGFACPRPTAYSPSIQPMINPRRFGAFPCGHAAEAFLVARLLRELSGQSAGSATESPSAFDVQLQRLAKRIADNRVVAGVHFPIDNVAGRMVGETFAEYVLARCRGGAWTPRGFNGEKTMDDSVKPPVPVPSLLRDFDRHEPMDAADATAKGRPLPPYFESLTGDVLPLEALDANVDPYAATDDIARSLLRHAWAKAKAEWDDWA